MPLPKPQSAVVAAPEPHRLPPELEAFLEAELAKPWTEREISSRRRRLPRSFSGIPSGRDTTSEADQVREALQRVGWEVREESDGSYGGGRSISVVAPEHIR